MGGLKNGEECRIVISRFEFAKRFEPLIVLYTRWYIFPRNPYHNPAFHRVESFLRDTYSSIIAINANKRFRRDNIYVARWWKLAICRTISVNVGNQKFVSAGGDDMPAYDIKYGVKKTRVAGESERLNFKRDF